jgi:hypothetical protein
MKIIHKTTKELIQKLTSKEEWKNKNVIFLIGAGCSRSSGNPGAEELATRWLRDIRDSLKDGDPLLQIEEDKITENYFQIFERRYPTSERKDAIKKFTSSNKPSSGYITLVNILEQEKKNSNKFNLILTTNFDTLIEQAFTIYTQERPMVVSDPTLIEYLNISDAEYSIVKMHGDRYFDPLNTEDGIKEINISIKEKLTDEIKNGILIVFGYSGNDKGVAEFLSNLAEKQRLHQIWWVNKNEPGKSVKLSFEKIDIKNFEFNFVNHFDFDMFMLKWQSQSYKSSKNKHVSIMKTDQHMFRYHESLIDKLNLYGGREESEFDNKKEEFDDYFQDIVNIHYVKKKYGEESEELKNIINLSLDKHLCIPNYQVFMAHIVKNILKDTEKSENILNTVIGKTNTKKFTNKHAAAFSYLALLLKDNYIKNKQSSSYEDIAEYFAYASEYDETNLNYKLNYAGFLLTHTGKLYMDKGIELLDECLENIYDSIYYMEACFYAFAHNVHSGNHKQYLDAIKTTLKDKKYSANFDLSLNVDSIKDKHKHKKFISNLAEAITGKIHNNGFNQKKLDEIILEIDGVINEYN